MSHLDRYSHLVFACVWSPYESTVAAVGEVLSEHGLASRFDVVEGAPEIGRVYTDAPPPGGRHLGRAGLLGPGGTENLVVFVANVSDGWQTMVNCVSGALGCECLAVTTTSERAPFPMHAFEMVEGGRSRRVVMASKGDRGWEFVERGTPLAFEDLPAYRRRRIADRLNRGILEAYLRVLGLEISSDDFWYGGGRATYFFENKLLTGT